VIAEEYWNQFRGPNGNGKTIAIGLPTKFSEGSKNIQWKTAIHGKGWSSPVVWGNQIWMTTATADGTKMYAVCVNAKSGNIIHDVLIFENVDPAYCHPTNSYASPTPVIEEGRIYVHFGTFGTACLDTKTAKVLWERRDLKCDHHRGPGSSPVVFQNLLIVNYDGVDVQYVVAFDKRTGETVWRKTRDIDYGTDNGDRKKAYGTPALFKIDGKHQLVNPTAVATIAYAPLTGEEIWRVRHGGMNAAAKPLLENGLIYINAGNGPRDLIAFRPPKSGVVSENEIAWTNSKSVPRRSSQLVVDDLFFMINDTGVASCLDAKTGKIHWQKRLEGKFWASPLYADGNIYFFGDDGRVPVVAAATEFKLLEDNRLNSGFNASPAVVGKALILRTKEHLYRLEE